MLRQLTSPARIAIVSLLCCLILGGCQKTVTTQSATVASGGYWSQPITLSGKSRVGIDLTSDRSVACFLMNDSDFSTFQMSINRGIGSFSYRQVLSTTSTTSFQEKAGLTGGTWHFVVMTSDYSRSGFGSPQVSNFTIKITGGMNASAGAPFANAPQVVQPPPTIVRQPPPQFNHTPPVPIAPPPRPMKVNFESLEEAIPYFSFGQQPERSAALAYVIQMPPDPAKSPGVIAAASPLIRDQMFAHQAVEIIVRWGGKEHAAAMRSALESLITGGASSPTVRNGDQALALAKLLASYGDAELPPILVRMLRSSAIHDRTVEILSSMGASAEAALIDGISKPQEQGRFREAASMEDAIAVLADIGTQKSVMPLQRIMSGKDATLSAAANESLRKLAARLKLKPDDYLNNLFNHYTFAVPNGFTPDSTMTDPNTRRWTRQSPGRAVKSSFTVQVQLVEKDYKIKPVPNGMTIKAPSLDFQATETAATAPQFTRIGRLQAVDGEYLIDVTVIADVSDGSVQTNVMDAIKKIKAK